MSQGSEIISFPSDSRFCGGIIVCQVGQRKRTYFFFLIKLLECPWWVLGHVRPGSGNFSLTRPSLVKCWSLRCVEHCFLKVPSSSSLLCMQEHDLLTPWALSAFTFLILFRDWAHCCLGPCGAFSHEVKASNRVFCLQGTEERWIGQALPASSHAQHTRSPGNLCILLSIWL